VADAGVLAGRRSGGGAMHIADIVQQSGPGRHSHSVERLREAVYGTIILLSVLAVLGEKEPSALDAGLSVVGTAVVLFLASVYAGAVAERFQAPEIRIACPHLVESGSSPWFLRGIA
jgi:hypothetical protein